MSRPKTPPERYELVWSPSRGKTIAATYDAAEGASRAAIDLCAREKMRPFAGDLFWDPAALRKLSGGAAHSCPRGTLTVRRVS